MESVLNLIEDTILDSLQNPLASTADLLNKVQAMDELDQIRSKVSAQLTANPISVEANFIKTKKITQGRFLKISSTDSEDQHDIDREAVQRDLPINSTSSERRRRVSVPDLITKIPRSRRKLSWQDQSNGKVNSFMNMLRQTSPRYESMEIFRMLQNDWLNKGSSNGRCELRDDILDSISGNVVSNSDDDENVDDVEKRLGRYISKTISRKTLNEYGWPSHNVTASKIDEYFDDVNLTRTSTPNVGSTKADSDSEHLIDNTCDTSLAWHRCQDHHQQQQQQQEDHVVKCCESASIDYSVIRCGTVNKPDNTNESLRKQLTEQTKLVNHDHKCGGTLLEKTYPQNGKHVIINIASPKENKSKMDHLKPSVTRQPCSPARTKRRAPPPPQSPSPQHHVTLPKSNKIRQARLMTFSTDLQAEFFKMLGRSHPVGCLCSKGAAANKNGAISVVKDIVTLYGLENPDHSGWLLDTTTGQKKWCVVADMLLCIFTGRLQEKPQKIIVIPSHTVRTLVFASAKRDTLTPDECLNKSRSQNHFSRTVSGTFRYQFILENVSADVSHAFGVESAKDLEKWVDILKLSSNLDVDLFCSEKPLVYGFQRGSLILDETDSRGASAPQSISAPKQNDIQRVGARNETGDMTYVPSSANVPRRMEKMKSFDEDIYKSDSSKSKEPLFTKVKRSDSCKESNKNDTERQGKKKPSSAKVRRHSSFENLISLLRRKKGSKEKDVAEGNRNSIACDELTIYVPQKEKHQQNTSPKNKHHGVDSIMCAQGNNTTPVLSATRRSVDHSQHNNLKISDNRLSSPKLKPDSLSPRTAGSRRPRDILAMSLPTQLSPEMTTPNHSASRSGLGSRIAVKANDLKDRVFGWRGNQTSDENLCLGQLKDKRLCCTLQHKQTVRWLKLHCVVANHYFYGYKSRSDEESPVVSVLLKECSLSLCGTENKSNKKIYMFKLCHFNARGLYFSAKNMQQFTQCIEVLKTETSSFMDFSSELGSSLPRLKINLASSEDMDTSCRKDPSDRSSNSEPMSPTTPDSALGLSMSSSVGRDTFSTKTRGRKKKPRNVSTSSSAPSELYTDSGALSANSSTNSFQNLLGKEGLGSVSVGGWDDSSSAEDYERGISFKAKLRLSSDSLGSCYSDRKSLLSDEGFEMETLNSEKDLELVSKPKRTTTDDTLAASRSGTSTEEGDAVLGSEPKTSENSSGNGDVKVTYDDVDGAVPSLSVRKNDTGEQNKHGAHVTSKVELVSSSPQTNGEMGNKMNEAKKKDMIEMARLGELRRRSLSTGDLPAPLARKVLTSHQKEGDSVKKTGMGQDLSACHRPRAPQNIPANQLISPAAQGYLDYLDEIGRWVSVWCVLKDHMLFIYQSPKDDRALDTVSLQGVTVQSRILPIEQRSWQLEIIHEDYAAEVLRAETETEKNVWLGYLQEACQKLTLDGLNLERGTGVQFDNDRDHDVAAAVDNEKEWQRELLKIKKQCLLEEVLKQKEEIEKRQGLYKPRQDNISNTKCSEKQETLIAKKDEVGANQLNDAGKQMLGLMHLKQRKVSTQLKVDSLQKSLQAHQNKKNKKKGFWFGSKGSDKSSSDTRPDTTYEQEHLEAQLQVLQEEMSAIDKNLVKKVQEFVQEAANPNLFSSLHEKEPRLSKHRSPVLNPYMTKSLSEDADSEGSTSKESSEKGSSESLHKPTVTDTKLVSADGSNKHQTGVSPVCQVKNKTNTEHKRQGTVDDGVLLRHGPNRDSLRYTWSPNKFSENASSIESFATIRPTKASKTKTTTDKEPRRGSLIPQELAQKSKQLPRAKVDVAGGGIPVSGCLDSVMFEENYSKSTSNSRKSPKTKATRDQPQVRHSSTSSDTSSDKHKISEDALQKIAAFEELLQENFLKV